MLNRIEKIYNDLSEQLNFIDLEVDDIILRCEKCIDIIIKSIQKTKQIILKSGFSSEQEEIYFFKDLKPQFTSKLIYYNSIYRIETKKPSGSQKVLKKYYIKELGKLKSYFDTNLDFYKYYRTGSTFLDYKYFVRGKFDIKLSLDNYFFETDKRFSTSHDFKVAKILANDLLRLYLENQLLEIEQERNHIISEASN